MVDSYARILAMAALSAAEDIGEQTKGISNVYIKDGMLHIVFTDGNDTEVGRVVGEDGKCYVPHIDKETKVLSWTIEDRAGVVPDPIDLGDESEWRPVDGPDQEEEYEWETI